MSTLRKRLESVEERIALRQHRELQLQVKGRSEDEQMFFCTHGYWPENASELPRRIEFTARGIKTVVTTQWEGEAQKTRAFGKLVWPMCRGDVS